MKYKALLLDFDGVLSPEGTFSDIYSQKYGIDIDVMLPFFKRMGATVTIGKGDLKEMLSEVKDTWKWESSVDDLLSFWLESDTDIDNDLKELALEFKTKGASLYLTTDQEKYKGEFIWKERGLKEWMDGKFISFEVGFTKNSPEFFEHIISTLQIHPSEILFVDDSISKVESARSVGIEAVHYESISDLKKHLSDS